MLLCVKPPSSSEIELQQLPTKWQNQERTTVAINKNFARPPYRYTPHRKNLMNNGCLGSADAVTDEERGGPGPVKIYTFSILFNNRQFLYLKINLKNTFLLCDIFISVCVSYNVPSAVIINN